MEELILEIIPKFLVVAGVMFVIGMVAIAAGFLIMIRRK